MINLIIVRLIGFWVMDLFGRIAEYIFLFLVSHSIYWLLQDHRLWLEINEEGSPREAYKYKFSTRKCFDVGRTSSTDKIFIHFILNCPYFLLDGSIIVTSTIWKKPKKKMNITINHFNFKACMWWLCCYLEDIVLLPSWTERVNLQYIMFFQ